MKTLAYLTLVALALPPSPIVAADGGPTPAAQSADDAERQHLSDLRRRGDDAIQARPSEGVEAWREYLAGIEALAAKYPDADLAQYAGSYLARVRAHAPDQERVMLRRLVGCPNRSIRDMATGWLQRLAQPLGLAFTAADGRPVDLQLLRGKVVLVDFWATWCGPCRAEIPNLVANYRKYHDLGFEIVGISLDRANAKQLLLDFTRSHDMPWPQYYDGKFWQNELAVKYGIQVIPAMFLLDQNGMIVSTDVHGAKLEQEIQRLLPR